MSDRIPVTVVSGNLGAGKTTLLNHLLETADRRLAVLVNDMGEVNVDASLLEDRLPSEGIAELSNGCICCELRDDLATAVRSLAADYEFDHLVVESSGISEPAPVARLFIAGDAAARFEVASLVTVVDSTVLARVAGEAVERETPPDAADRPLADLLIEQIEVSNVVLLNKCDLLSEAELDRLEAIVRGLQPDAEVVRTTYCEVDPDRLFETRFDPDELGELAGWQRALEAGIDGDHTDHDHDGGGRVDHDDHDHRSPESVYGVGSHTLRRRRPLDPARFATFLRELDVVRAKGVCWIAGRDDLAVHASVAGRSVSATGEGPWIASLPPSRRELYRGNHPDLHWDDDHGDRRTELVCIGRDLDVAALEDGLDACLVGDEGRERGDGDDPFPTEQGERTVLRE